MPITLKNTDSEKRMKDIVLPEGALAIKDRLMATANQRKRQTIEAIWKLLVEMWQQKIRVYTVAKVGAALETRGILKTQSLRNATGRDYRTLIEGFALAPETAGSASMTPLQDAIRQLNDLDIRTRLNSILHENHRLREENNRLREGFRKLRLTPGNPKQDIAKEPGLALESDVIEAARLNIKPLQQFLSEAWLDERRWVIQPSGAIKDEDNYYVTPSGFVPALEEVIRKVAK